MTEAQSVTSITSAQHGSTISDEEGRRPTGSDRKGLICVAKVTAINPYSRGNAMVRREDDTRQREEFVEGDVCSTR